MSVLEQSIEVARPIHEVFAYIADFSTTQEWDSTATVARKLTPGPITVGTQFYVNCTAPIGSIDLTYTVKKLEINKTISLAGRSRFFDIRDDISFSSTDKGTRIDYRAEFHFPAALKRLAKSFDAGLQRMGKHSMEGMRAALEDENPAPSESKSSRLADKFILPGLVKFTKRGYTQGLRNWLPNSSYIADKHIVITGASAGLGYAAAMDLARRGADITLVVRNREKGEQILEAIAAETGNEKLHLELADLSLLADVDSLVTRLLAQGNPIDVLINNAGALFNPRQETSEGIEASLALLLLSPYRLTEGLQPLLEASSDARVINVVSGGMYSQKLELDGLLERRKEKYSGSVAYARAKRALMVMTQEWATRWAEKGIVVNAMHPGWADTPGVESALPEFHKLTKYWLRTPEQGADTIIWLASAKEAAKASGKLFLDRRPHSPHLLSSTQESANERIALINYLQQTLSDNLQ